MSFKVGDKVQWKSQSRGFHKTKQGIIIAVIPVDIRPKIPDGLRVLGVGFGYGGRKQESYLVRVGNVAYWPLVKYLELVF